MATLAHHQRLDWGQPLAFSAPRCRTAPLFEPGGGKMFGLLCCRDHQGAPVVLRAFSGQYNGLWLIEGFVPPIFDPAALETLMFEPEREIKRLGAVMATMPAGTEPWRALKRERRSLSRQLMQEVHRLYWLQNFRGERRALTQVFHGNGGPPSGTGDCCGPKLLHYAAVHGLQPEAMAEFFWGCGTASTGREHGRLYPACHHKCSPILGFQLCGLP